MTIPLPELSNSYFGVGYDERGSHILMSLDVFKRECKNIDYQNELDLAGLVFKWTNLPVSKLSNLSVQFNVDGRMRINYTLTPEIS